MSELPPLEVPLDARLHTVIDAVRRKERVANHVLDAIYPDAIRARSSQYWTPIDVARRAAELLVTGPDSRVLDVGSGAGKFCLVGALTSVGSFTGVEQRGHLVAVARTIAQRYRASRAHYVHGDMRSVDWRSFTGFYFFNPFAENYFDGHDRLDETVELTHARFDQDISWAIAMLACAAPGTRVATYHGIGRDMPASFVHVSSEEAGTDTLELWVQGDPSRC